MVGDFRSFSLRRCHDEQALGPSEGVNTAGCARSLGPFFIITGSRVAVSTLVNAVFRPLCANPEFAAPSLHKPPIDINRFNYEVLISDSCKIFANRALRPCEPSQGIRQTFSPPIASSGSLCHHPRPWICRAASTPEEFIPRKWRNW